MSHDPDIIKTTFKEFQGTYEFYKAQALAKHLRLIADRATRATHVRVCPKAPERPWVTLMEWESPGGLREGQWASDIEFGPLP